MLEERKKNPSRTGPRPTNSASGDRPVTALPPPWHTHHHHHRDRPGLARLRMTLSTRSSTQSRSRKASSSHRLHQQRPIAGPAWSDHRHTPTLLPVVLDPVTRTGLPGAAAPLKSRRQRARDLAGSVRCTCLS
ncbi:hypothetical protein LX32DRAFT_18881 [Colletotrichum zoysiae]|uniref:Uncharacterized protein n=1 Tax=Colletotrichum zoysiae TaxID=1216348 RepID=A0AAD9HCV9_9PEZI|nr:hypothetical protein LX32DRAFT_18881 [Colletotrichum zoysiae]